MFVIKVFDSALVDTHAFLLLQKQFACYNDI